MCFTKFYNTLHFKEEPYKNLPYLKCPLHTLLKLSPKPYGCDVTPIKFDIQSVDTYRPQSSLPSSLPSMARWKF